MKSGAKKLKAAEVILVSPAAREDNNGNWHTAHRWARFLSSHCDITPLQQWLGVPAGAIRSSEPQALIALHARRSAESIQAWASAYPGKPLVVVLTGTDLYRDIHHDASARQSLALASQLVLLQEDGFAALPKVWHSKAQVIYQSANRLVPAIKSQRTFRALMVGHLRQEKDPLTFMNAAARAQTAGIFFDQIGLALEPSFAQAAQARAEETPRYRWLGGQPRAATRQAIKRAHVLINCSQMEGGAHVILEAVQAGTPVLATRISGNIGMLGAGYAGFFELGNDAQLAALVSRCAEKPDFLALLQSQCSQRAPLFNAQTEKRLVINLVQSALRLPLRLQKDRHECP